MLNSLYKTLWRKRSRNRRRTEAKDFLGGECISCGSTSNLEFDHIDPRLKLFEMSIAMDRNSNIWWNEVKKCQLLCVDCHRRKTQAEQSGGKFVGNNEMFPWELDIELEELF